MVFLLSRSSLVVPWTVADFLHVWKGLEWIGCVGGNRTGFLVHCGAQFIEKGTDCLRGRREAGALY